MQRKSDDPGATTDGRLAQRLWALFAGGWLVFDYPLLSLWDRDATVFGIPLFPAALFIGWAAIIAVLAWIAERGEG